MVLIPPRDTTITRIYSKYSDKQKVDPKRLHLGASEIGRECERQIWYSFRWVKETEFPGQILRLFDTGKLEENRIVSDLNSIGVDVRPFDLKTGRQYRMDLFGGHFGGSLDGLCLGLVEAPKTWHVLEMKTHNDKSFKTLIDKGVKEAKPEHWMQMQSYMGMSHEQPLDGFPPFTRSFYFAVNKNTDELYTERVEYEGEAYLRIKEKARRIIFASTPLPKISEKPSFFQCKFCLFNKICHASAPNEIEIPQKNCRTCVHSTAYDDGTWRCEKWNQVLGLKEQIAGCEKHLYIPNLLPYKQTDVIENGIVYEDNDKNIIINYEGGEIVKG